MTVPRRMLSTAKAAVSASIPTLTQPSLAANSRRPRSSRNGSSLQNRVRMLSTSIMTPRYRYPSQDHNNSVILSLRCSPHPDSFISRQIQSYPDRVVSADESGDQCPQKCAYTLFQFERHRGLLKNRSHPQIQDREARPRNPDSSGEQQSSSQTPKAQAQIPSQVHCASSRQIVGGLPRLACSIRERQLPGMSRGDIARLYGAAMESCPLTAGNGAPLRTPARAHAAQRRRCPISDCTVRQISNLQCDPSTSATRRS